MVDKKEIQMTLRFGDAMIHALGCILDQFTQDYTENKVIERVKDSFLKKLLLQIIIQTI
jgi:hypothetical protein